MKKNMSFVDFVNLVDDDYSKPWQQAILAAMENAPDMYFLHYRDNRNERWRLTLDSLKSSWLLGRSTVLHTFDIEYRKKKSTIIIDDVLTN